MVSVKARGSLPFSRCIRKRLRWHFTWRINRRTRSPKFPQRNVKKKQQTDTDCVCVHTCVRGKQPKTSPTWWRDVPRASGKLGVCAHNTILPGIPFKWADQLPWKQCRTLPGRANLQNNNMDTWKRQKVWLLRGGKWKVSAKQRLDFPSTKYEPQIL